MRRAGGFSLLELLVAVGVLAVLASVSFRGLGPILDTQVHVQAEAHRWSDAARLMEQLSRDLSLALERPVVDESGQLLITRLGDDDPEGSQGGARRVGYRLRAGTLEYLAWAGKNSSVDAAPLVSPVFDNAAALELRALDADGRWSSLRAMPAAPASLPRAVEVQIVLAGGERLTRLFPLR